MINIWMLKCCCLRVEIAKNHDASVDVNVKKISSNVQILLQFNSFCIQRLKCFNEIANCSSIVDLHMNSMISKNRLWRIELCVDVCDDVFECNENEKRKRKTFYFVEFDVWKDSTHNIFCNMLSILLIFTALKSVWWTS